MNFWIGLIISSIMLIATIAVFATKLFFPYHRVAALVIYAIGWVPFLYSVSLKKNFILQHKNTAQSFLAAYWVHIAFGIMMLAVLYVFLVLFPVARSPFIGMSDEAIKKSLKEDKTVIEYLDNRLFRALDAAAGENLFAIDFKNISTEEKEKLKDFWADQIEILLELDIAKERYKTFYQLNVITQKELHQAAFLNGYTALVSQLYNTFRLIENINDQNLINYLNDGFVDKGVSRGTYDMLKSKATDSNELLRLNAGRAYRAIIGVSGKDDIVDKYLQAIDNSVGEYAGLISKKPLRFLEKKSFGLWFPLQKKAAINISYIHTASRDYHIDAKQINSFRNRLLPGDIMLERREWHATNVGIPGYWTHSALFIGSLDEMSAHFNGTPELKGTAFDDYLKEKYPKAYEGLLKNDDNGFKMAVIESKRPGVILTSLEYSANCDTLGILRVKNLDRSMRLKIVLQALDHFGKLYDYDFDFSTDSALVCSELVYKAYIDIKNLNITLQELNGRLIISPNQFAEKFANEYKSESSELELVLFLDGNEKKGVAIEKDAGEFKETWLRPKWYIVRDYR